MRNINIRATDDAELATYIDNWSDGRNVEPVTPRGAFPITIPGEAGGATYFVDQHTIAAMAANGELAPAPLGYTMPRPRPRRRAIGSAAMAAAPLEHPLTIDPAAVPWASVPAFTSGIAEWLADAHLTATGRTEGTVEWVSRLADKTRNEVRGYLSGTTRWPMPTLIGLLNTLGYEGGITDDADGTGDILTLTDDETMPLRAVEWCRRALERHGIRWSATEVHRALLADAERYGDAVIPGAPRGFAMVTAQMIHGIMAGTSQISVIVLYRFCRLINARGMWRSRTMPAVAMPGGLVTRRMAWSGEPLKNSRVAHIEPAAQSAEQPQQQAHYVTREA